MRTWKILTLVSLVLWPVALLCAQAFYDDDAGTGGWALLAWIGDSILVVGLLLAGLIAAALRRLR
jgi:hypothetical protein